MTQKYREQETELEEQERTEEILRKGKGKSRWKDRKEQNWTARFRNGRQRLLKISA